MIGIINFSHSDPLYLAIEDKGKVLRESPGKIFKFLEDGKLDLGMVSLVTYLENRDRYNLVKTANIHSLRTTMSTILVSRDNKIKDGMKIAVTGHTKTTEFYLSSVLEKLKVEYDLIHTDKTSADDLLDMAEYALVIGDEAMSVYGTDQNILMDIGYEFSRLYSLSPVYAVTVTRGSPEAYEVELLDRAVSGAENYREVAARENSEKFGLSENIFKRYYSLIRYDFNRNVERTIDFLSASRISEKTIE